MRRSLLRLLALSASIGLAACAAPAKPAPKGPPDAGASSVAAPADPEASLASAERDLDAALGVPRAPGAEVATSPENEAADKNLKKDEERVSRDAPCRTACTALASMQRAAAHLCGITGDADARCGVAKTRVRRAAERVRISCPVCAAAKE